MLTFPFYPFKNAVSSTERTELFRHIFPHGCSRLTFNVPKFNQSDKFQKIILKSKNIGLSIKYGILSMQKQKFARIKSEWQQSKEENANLWILVIDDNHLISLCKVIDIDPSQSFKFWFVTSWEYPSGIITVEHYVLGGLQVEKNLMNSIRNSPNQIILQLIESEFRLSAILEADQYEHQLRLKFEKGSPQELALIDKFIQTGIASLAEYIQQYEQSNQNRRN